MPNEKTDSPGGMFDPFLSQTRIDFQLSRMHKLINRNPVISKIPYGSKSER
jgi:hypothetical protein